MQIHSLNKTKSSKQKKNASISFTMVTIASLVAMTASPTSALMSGKVNRLSQGSRTSSHSSFIRFCPETMPNRKQEHGGALMMSSVLEDTSVLTSRGSSRRNKLKENDTTATLKGNSQNSDSLSTMSSSSNVEYMSHSKIASYLDSISNLSSEDTFTDDNNITYGVNGERISSERTDQSNKKMDEQSKQPSLPSKKLIDGEKLGSKKVQMLQPMTQNDSIRTKARIAAPTRVRKTRPKMSRSSTMPGFANRDSMRIRAYNDGIEIVEKKTGRKIRKDETVAAKVSKQNSDQMYLASASVPDSLVHFVSQIHKESRITPAEEIKLGTKTQEAIRLQELYDDLEMKLNREPTDEEWCAAAGKINTEALRQTIEEGIEAKNKLVTANLRMVQRVVNLYIRNGLGSEYNAGDMMQDGSMALIRAAEKFEPERGFRFSTYAMYWIRASVKRSQILQSGPINVPQRLHETYKKVRKVESELEESLGRKPTAEELAEAANLTVVQLERCVKAMKQQCQSLDAEITNSKKPQGNGKRKKDTLYDLVSNKADDAELTRQERLFLKEDLVNSLRRYLSPHEADLILLRYGLMDERTLPHGFSGPLTINEVSRLVGIKPDKVRRIINKSLTRLKHLIAHEWENEVI